MTGASLARALVDRGLDAADAPSAAAVFDRVLAAVAPEGGGSWSAWWTPGRLEVFGKHTDYAGGRSLVCAVPRGIALLARARDDGRWIIRDVVSNESAEIAPGEPHGTHAGWARYAAATCHRLARNFPQAVGGADLVFASSLPRASGMSSSSALVVSIASAIADLSDLPTHGAWTKNIETPLDRAGYFACIENGRSFGSLDGDAGVGTHGGSEDHAAIITAQPSHVTAFRFAPTARLDDAVVPADWCFAIAPSGVRAEKTGGAQGRYNHLAAQAAALLAVWNRHESPAGSLGAVLARAGAAARLRDLLSAVAADADSVDALDRRLEHFVIEDGIVAAALHGFQTADARSVGALSAASQDAAERLLGNQVPETSALVHEARRLGAIASCSFGAGFGGSVWSIVSDRDATAFAAAWHRDSFLMRPAPAQARLA